MVNSPDEHTPLLASGIDTPLTESTLVNVDNTSELSSIHAEAGNDQTKPRVSMVAVISPMLLGIFLVALDTTVITSTYASIGSQFEQLQNTSWIATGYMLSLTSFQPLYGKLSDIFGRKSCLLFAYSVFALGCLCCGLARNMTELITARALAGVGGGGISTMTSIIMSDVATLRQRGMLQGVANIAWAIGQATGAPLGGIMADGVGWRWAFLLQVPVTVLAILSVGLGLNLPRPSAGNFREKLARVDFAGAGMLVVSMFLLLFGLDRGGNVSWTDHMTIVSLLLSAIFLVMFVAVELRWAREPFAPKRIVVHPTLLASYLCNLFSNGATITVFFHVSLYLQAVRGFSASDVGLTLLPTIFGGVSGSLAAGLFMQKTGKYYVFTLAMFVLMLVGNIMISLVTGVTAFSLAGLIFGIIVNNFGIGAGINSTLVALIANAGPDDQAIATAVSYLFRSLGSVVGLSVGTALAQDILRQSLRKRLTGQPGVDVDEITRRVRESLGYIGQLEPAVRAKVVRSYQDGLQATFWFTVTLSALTVLISLYIKEKPLAR